MVTTKERSFIASSISPVATIWQSAPSNSHGQNAGVGHGNRSPVAISTIAKNRTENGNPNRKRILVAPQAPRGAVSCRCIALRATCASAAVMVKGIQSEAMVNISGGFEGAGRLAATVKGAARQVNRPRPHGGMRSLPPQAACAEATTSSASGVDLTFATHLAAGSKANVKS